MMRLDALKRNSISVRDRRCRATRDRGAVRRAMGAGVRTRGQKRTRRKTTRYDGTPATMDDGCASAKRKSGHLTSARRGKGKGDDDDAGGKKKRGRPRKGEGVVTNPVRVIFLFCSL